MPNFRQLLLMELSTREEDNRRITEQENKITEITIASKVFMEYS